MSNAKTRWATAALAASLALSVASCGQTPEPAPAAATPDSPVTLEFWGSNASLGKLADLFNEKEAGSKITVKFTEQTGNEQLLTNLRNASSAGSAPCLFDATTEAVVSLASDGVIGDVSEIVSEYKSDYSEQAWEAVTTGDQQFGLPAASIPNFMLYNSRVFAEAGIQYPKTWTEFIEAGKALKDRGVKIYNLAGEDYSTFVYLAWQAGARWWELDGDAWKIDVDSEETAKAAEVLQQMLDNDLVDKISYAEFAAMMKDYNDGQIASRQLSTWQTKSMQNNLTTGLGEWEAAPNPAFEGEEPANVSFTRAYSITKDCKDQKAAAYVAHWMSTNEDAVALNASPKDGASWFPAVADPQPYISVSLPDKLMGEHAPTWDPTVKDAVEHQKGDWTYGPNASAAFKVLADQWGQAVAGKIKVADIAPYMQKWITEDLKKSGVETK